MPHTYFISYTDLAEGRVIYEPWQPAPITFTPLAAALPDGRFGWGDLYAKTVLITQTGQFFDDLLLANYYAEVLEFAGRVVIEAHVVWHDLWRRTFPAAQVVESWQGLGDDRPRVDFHVAARDLPLYFGRQVDIFVEKRAVLQVDEALVQRWRERWPAAGQAGPVMGVYWKGEWEEAGQWLESWRTLLNYDKSFCFVNLQAGVDAPEVAVVREQLGVTVLEVDSLEDGGLEAGGLAHGAGVPEGLNAGNGLAMIGGERLDALAALCRSCDTVITSDPALLLLAASVGVRAWAARPEGWSPCETTMPPWYPAWRDGGNGEALDAVCVARFHSPWGLPRQTRVLTWLALEQDEAAAGDLTPLHSLLPTADRIKPSAL